jgi:acyl homoserine lactone synthase
MDQYDNPCAHYSLVLRHGEVVGGARIMPTSSVWGHNTYMLRDAQQGRIDQIPADVLRSDIASDDVWECTRLVTSDQVRTQSERADCLALIVEGLIEIANLYGGIEMVTLTRPSLMRALRQLGFSVSQDGDAYFSEADGHRYAVLRMPAMRTSHLIAAE